MTQWSNCSAAIKYGLSNMGWYGLQRNSPPNENSCSPLAYGLAAIDSGVLAVLKPALQPHDAAAGEWLQPR